MMAIPATASEFYARRDHRTDMYLGVAPAYASKSVLITADKTALHTYQGQLVACLVANLLSRWCRRAVVAVGDIDLHPLMGAGRLTERILRQMSDADPFGEFVLGEPDEASDLRLHIGAEATQVVGGPPTTVLSCSGWFAAVCRSGEEGLGFDPDDLNPVGAACAAVLGGAQIFRDALDMCETFPTGFLFDGFTGLPVSRVEPRSAFPRNFDAGKVLMVGAGAVGSSAAFFMDLFGLKAHLTCADADEVKIENLGRTPAYTASSCGQKKVEALSQMLSGRSLNVIPVPLWWHELDSQDLRPFDIVIPVANEHGVRAHIQRALPPLMIHASTGGNWLVNFGRHIPGRNDCLAERFARFEEAPPLACSSGSVPVAKDQSVDASLPFLSFWAGLLVATDIVRLGVGDYPHTANSGEYHFRKRFVTRMLPRNARDDCECRKQGVNFARFRNDGRFRGLSPATW